MWTGVERVEGPLKPQKITLNFSYWELESREVVLIVTMMSPTKGILRPPFWNDNTNYMNFFSLTASIDVLADHAVFISWEHMAVGSIETCRVRLEIRLIGVIDAVKKYCGVSTPRPALFQCRRLVVTLLEIPYQNIEERNGGFSMRFSFHNNNTQPQQLTDATWNCSVPHWPDFQQHLLCNLLTECAGGEDEVNCSYSAGETCGHGYMAAGGSCFFYEANLGRPLSWYEAAERCRSLGGHLPTLNTQDKWRAVLGLLSHRRCEKVYVGLTSDHPSLPDQYRHFLQWTDQSVAYYMKAEFLKPSNPNCAFLLGLKKPGSLYMDNCWRKVLGDLLCEKPQPYSEHGIELPVPGTNMSSRPNITQCPKGYLTHNFLSCDPRSACWASDDKSCSVALTAHPPSFACRQGLQTVPFTLVCDHRSDCDDSSDEDFCVFRHCLESEFKCANLHCIPNEKRCDGVSNCIDPLDTSDEFDCIVKHSFPAINESKPIAASALLYWNGSYGLTDIARDSHQSSSFQINGSSYCPESHFRCPGVRYYCLPVYVLCNGVYDCPGHEDEAACANFTCSGFYRCRGSDLCVHIDHLCDGIGQCPEEDDELACGPVCPQSCTCYGLAFYCTGQFNASRHSELRFLDASGTRMTLDALTENTMLLHLRLANCGITNFATLNFFNIMHLDLSHNHIYVIDKRFIHLCKNLQTLVLRGNPITAIFLDTLSSNSSLKLLYTLDLSFVQFQSLNFENLQFVPNVLNLNLSHTGLNTVSRASGFAVFKNLQVLDLRGSPMAYFNRYIFLGLEHLTTVYADNYRLCCPAMLPEGFNALNCHAPFDEVSSCEGLLKSAVYRVSLSILTSMTLLGNAASFVYRVIIKGAKTPSSVRLFVTNLCVSDCLMGLYSAVIGVADQMYLGKYVWIDVEWRHSTVCNLAGFLSLVSNEVSAFIICLITVDRFLVTRFPHSRQFHFTVSSARSVVFLVWALVIMLAAVPLLTDWEFYSQTGLCIPLLFARKLFQGRDFAFGVMIILNLLLFLTVLVGQASVYWSVLTSVTTASDTAQKSKDLITARRVMSVAGVNFLCWFPVCLLGLLTWTRAVTVTRSADELVAILVLPLRAALNPLLYALNVLTERRNRAQEERLQKVILASHGLRKRTHNNKRDKAVEALNYTAEEAHALIRRVFRAGVLTREDVMKVANSGGGNDDVSLLPVM